MKKEELRKSMEGLLDYLEDDSGKLVLKALFGELPLYAIDNMLPEEKDMVLYLLILRRHLYDIGDK